MKGTLLIGLITILLSYSNMLAQCQDPGNGYYFMYDLKTYQVVLENATWEEAAACALSQGASLARIDDQAEQDAIFNELMNNAGIDTNNTIAPDGGGAAYVWIGGNDLDTEGEWIWDGDNDGVGEQFWMGDFNGSPVNGLYNNWGGEPDNFQNQDALGLALTDWPFGVAGEWNDVDHENTLYFIIEHPEILDVNDYNRVTNFQIYPNPTNNQLSVSNNQPSKIYEISVVSLDGSILKKINPSLQNPTIQINVSALSNGLYVIKVEFDNGRTAFQKFVKG